MVSEETMEEWKELQKVYEETKDKARRWLQAASPKDINMLRTEHPDLYATFFEPILIEVREDRAKKVVNQFLSPDTFEVLSENDHVAVFIALESIGEVEVATLVRIVDGLSNEFGILREKFALFPATPKEDLQRIELGFSLSE